MSDILKFYCSKFQPSSAKLRVVRNMECTKNSEIRQFLELNFGFSESKKGEGQNFEQWNFRIAYILNLKINERANVERPNLRESL